MIVLRDISERFQRFEAEKQLVIEVTERKKDAEANRFTRHEVKNGLLAAIGLVDSMREQSFPGGNGEGGTNGSTRAMPLPITRRTVHEIFHRLQKILLPTRTGRYLGIHPNYLSLHPKGAVPRPLLTLRKA